MGMIANYHAYLAVGIILVLLGVLSWSERLPYNYVAGIRIPSVMEDKSSWRAGHRASGPAMVALGGASFVFGVVSWIARLDSWVDLTVWAVLLLAGMAYVVVRASNAARAVHRR